MVLERPRASDLHPRMVLVAALCAGVLCATQAQGEDRASCISAHEQSQVLRKEGKLREAREQLISCSAEACPTVLRKDCSQWLSEVSESLPTVVFEAKGPTGKEVIEVSVSVDGHPLADKLEGRALAVDPGLHVFRFELEGAPAREEKIVIREGQKNRKIMIDFSPPRAAASASAAPVASQTPEPQAVERPTPLVVYVLGGLGLAALGTSAFFEARGLGQRSDLDDKGCKPGCPQDEVDAAKRSILIGDIALGAGVLSLGLATILYLTRPEVKTTPEAAWRLNLESIPGGGVAALRGAF